VIKLLSETLIIGEEHPGILIKMKEEEYSISLADYEGELVLSGKYSQECIKREVEEFGEKLRKLYLEPCKNVARIISEAECELIRKYRPEIVFLEVTEGQEDIIKVVNEIGAKLTTFHRYKSRSQYHNNLLKHLKSLVNDSNYSKKIAIIGIAHLFSVKDSLGRSNVNYIMYSSLPSWY